MRDLIVLKDSYLQQAMYSITPTIDSLLTPGRRGRRATTMCVVFPDVGTA